MTIIIVIFIKLPNIKKLAYSDISIQLYILLFKALELYLIHVQGDYFFANTYFNIFILNQNTYYFDNFIKIEFPKSS